MLCRHDTFIRQHMTPRSIFSTTKYPSLLETMINHAEQGKHDGDEACGQGTSSLPYSSLPGLICIGSQVTTIHRGLASASLYLQETNASSWLMKLCQVNLPLHASVACSCSLIVKHLALSTAMLELPCLPCLRVEPLALSQGKTLAHII